MISHLAVHAVYATCNIQNCHCPSTCRSLPVSFPDHISSDTSTLITSMLPQVPHKALELRLLPLLDPRQKIFGSTRRGRCPSFAPPTSEGLHLVHELLG